MLFLTAVAVQVRAVGTIFFVYTLDKSKIIYYNMYNKFIHVDGLLPPKKMELLW